MAEAAYTVGSSRRSSLGEQSAGDS